MGIIADHRCFTRGVGKAWEYPNSVRSFAFGLTIRDLSENQFAGGIPNSYYSIAFLKKLDLSKNMLSGSIASFKDSTSLKSLKLNDNSFEGELPEDSFRDLSELLFINVGGNERLTGVFPQPGLKTQLM